MIETRECPGCGGLVMLMLAVALLMVDWTNSRITGIQLQKSSPTPAGSGLPYSPTLVICAYFRDSAKRLRRENGELISHLADYGSRLENKSNQAISLKDLSEQLIGSTELDSALHLIIHVGIDTFAADTASIMLREKDGDALAIAASYGIPEEIVRNTRVRLGEGLAGMVAQEGKPVVLNSDELDGEAAKRAVRGDIIVSSVIIPILVDTQVRGVLSTAKRRGGTCFDDEDMAALTTLANQASLVIEKMDLLDHLRHQVETLADTVRELRQTRAELLQSEKLANIGQLASGVAHEINNPLQVVLGRTELLVSNLTTGVTKPAPREHTVRIADIVSPCSASRQSSNRVPRDDVNAVLSEDHGPSGAADGGRYRCGDGYA